MKNRAYENPINPKNDRYERGLASKVYNLFDKKSVLGAKANANEELQKPVSKEFRKMELSWV